MTEPPTRVRPFQVAAYPSAEADGRQLFDADSAGVNTLRPIELTPDHQALLELAASLEQARLRNLAAAHARVVLHSGDMGIVETGREFKTELASAQKQGRPVDPRFRGWPEWQQTASELHRARQAMYPSDHNEHLHALARGDMEAMPWALVFLEADPRCFRAGYVRERLLRYVCRLVPRLSESHLQRLRSVALRAVDDPWRPSGTDRYAHVPAVQRMRAKMSPSIAAAMAMHDKRRLAYVQRREFTWYCRLAARLRGADLITELRMRTASDDAVVALRAKLILGAIERRQRLASQAETAT